MCGRYQFSMEQCEEIQRIAQAIDKKYGMDAWRPGEICPSAAAPVLLGGRNGLHVSLMSWGYPATGHLVINARAESAAEKPMFRESVANRRCVIPSTGFFEWDTEKKKYFFKLPGEPILYMAGLWTKYQGRPCYTILITAANASMQPIHDRMPVVLPRSKLQAWLEDSSASEEMLRTVPPELEVSACDAQLRLW